MTPDIPSEWTAWITENLLRGAERRHIIATLVQQGLDGQAATAEVRRIGSSGILLGARRLLARSAGVEQAARLRRHFEALATFECDELDESGFFERHWCGHRPVVFRGAAEMWPEWSLEQLTHRYGETEVSVLEGRDREPQWWKRREALTRTLPLSELIERMRSTVGNDLYGVGRNDLLDAMPELADDIGTLPGIGAKLHAKLWVGPEGTFTPLHHDQSAAWLVQRIGRKRVWIASPLEPSLLDTTEGVFNLADAREPTGEQQEVRWIETVIEPGDAVFLPAGWWHQVLAEAPSVSVSVGGFRWDNRFTWYAPGRYGS